MLPISVAFLRTPIKLFSKNALTIHMYLSKKIPTKLLTAILRPSWYDKYCINGIECPIPGDWWRLMRMLGSLSHSVKPCCSVYSPPRRLYLYYHEHRDVDVNLRSLRKDTHPLLTWLASTPHKTYSESSPLITRSITYSKDTRASIH